LQNIQKFLPFVAAPTAQPLTFYAKNSISINSNWNDNLISLSFSFSLQFFPSFMYVKQ
jgi:hypothetical protein